VGGALLLGGASLSSTRAFTTARGTRGTAVNVASPENAILGLTGQGPVQKNQREPMLLVTNNASDTISVTVTLQDCSQGTLYDNNGGSGCSVTFSLASGNSDAVDISASVVGTIAYTVQSTSASMNIQTTGEVTAEAGNVKGAVRIQQPNKDQDFTAMESQNVFEAAKVDVRDGDGDADLDRIEFRVRVGGSAGTVVGSYDVTNPPGDRYAPNGNPAVSFPPDGGYSIAQNTTYALTITAFDADGNYAAETFEDTA
jgi:hypothetical protein